MRKPLHKVELRSDIKDFVDLRMSDKEYIIKIKRENVLYIDLQEAEENNFEIYVWGKTNG